MTKNKCCALREIVDIHTSIMPVEESARALVSRDFRKSEILNGFSLNTAQRLVSA